MPWVSKKTWEYLQAELEYWRDQAQKEQLRADRAVDRVLASVHSMPISELGLGEAQERIAANEKAVVQKQREMDEIFNDTECDVLQNSEL